MGRYVVHFQPLQPRCASILGQNWFMHTVSVLYHQCMNVCEWLEILTVYSSLCHQWQCEWVNVTLLFWGKKTKQSGFSVIFWDKLLNKPKTLAKLITIGGTVSPFNFPAGNPVWMPECVSFEGPAMDWQPVRGVVPATQCGDRQLCISLFKMFIYLLSAVYFSHHGNTHPSL